MPGVRCEYWENRVGTKSVSRVPRFYSRLGDNGAKASTGKAEGNQSRSSEITRGGVSISSCIGTPTGQNECNNPSNPTSPLFYRHLQMDLSAALRASAQDYKMTLRSSLEGRNKLIWWDKQMVRWNGRSVMIKDLDLTVDSDALILGWGVSCQSVSTGGPWSPQERTRHINCLELMTATLALKTFMKNKTGLSV